MDTVRKFIYAADNLPKIAKILIGIFTFPVGLLFFFLLVPMWKSGIETGDSVGAVINNPTEENLLILMERLEKSDIDNHPDTWQTVRGLWNVVNRSNQITTPTKEKFIAQLIAKGLYISNTNVIDNYGKPYNRKNNTNRNRQSDMGVNNQANYNPDDDFLQEEILRQQNEWAMEEACKSVTPFDMGGYVQGDGFNPSDTMATDAQREQMNQMNDMNNMNNMGMF